MSFKINRFWGSLIFALLGLLALSGHPAEAQASFEVRYYARYYDEGDWNEVTGDQLPAGVAQQADQFVANWHGMSCNSEYYNQDDPDWGVRICPTGSAVEVVAHSFMRQIIYPQYITWEDLSTQEVAAFWETLEIVTDNVMNNTHDPMIVCHGYTFYYVQEGYTVLERTSATYCLNYYDGPAPVIPVVPVTVPGAVVPASAPSCDGCLQFSGINGQGISVFDVDGNYNVYRTVNETLPSLVISVEKAQLVEGAQFTSVDGSVTISYVAPGQHQINVRGIFHLDDAGQPIEQFAIWQIGAILSNAIPVHTLE